MVIASYGAVPPERETMNRRLAWVISGFCGTSTLLTLHIEVSIFDFKKSRGKIDPV